MPATASSRTSVACACRSVSYMVMSRTGMYRDRFAAGRPLPTTRSEKQGPPVVWRTTEWPPEQDSTNPHPLLLRTRSSLAPGTRSITLAMALQLQLHPNVAPLFGQAQVTARGPNPQLMCDPGHTLHGYNANS